MGQPRQNKPRDFHHTQYQSADRTEALGAYLSEAWCGNPHGGSSQGTQHRRQLTAIDRHTKIAFDDTRGFWRRGWWLLAEGTGAPKPKTQDGASGGEPAVLHRQTVGGGL